MYYIHMHIHMCILLVLLRPTGPARLVMEGALEDRHSHTGENFGASLLWSDFWGGVQFEPLDINLGAL